jgi:hypothetical protein
VFQKLDWILDDGPSKIAFGILPTLARTLRSFLSSAQPMVRMASRFQIGLQVFPLPSGSFLLREWAKARERLAIIHST